ncbi:MAG: GNAT family N-acetyltransferase [Acidimicrobiales bacterium]|jgi:RimJ/RimL family protein N-acetyltransferase/acyl carrier protein
MSGHPTFAAGPLAESSSVPTFAEFCSAVSNELLVDLDGASEESLLVDDLGFDSLALIELVVLAERWAAAPWPEDLIASLRTLGDVYHHLCTSAQDGPRPSAPGAPGRLEGPNVSLRPVLAQDESYLTALHLWGDGFIRYRFRGRTPNPDALRRLLWEEVLAQFMITCGGGRRVGLVSAFEPDPRNRTVHLAVLQDPEWAGSGLALEGVAVFLSYLFSQFDLRKVYAECLEGNYTPFASGSGRFFDVEGRLRAHEYVDGRYEDVYLLAVERSRWADQHRRLFGQDVPWR